MKIGVLTMSISRQSGGLLWAVRSLALSLTEAGSCVKIFAGKDRDTEADLPYWDGLQVVTMSRYGPSSFGYMPALRSALRDADLDLLHTHGLWMYPSVAALGFHRKNKRPLVISPHGMLDPWALSNSAWKKRLATLCYERAHLQAAACLHALSQSEYESIRAYGLTNPVAIVPSGVDLPGLNTNQPEAKWGSNLPIDSRVLLFMSRIHHKKGLGNVLPAFAQVRRESPSAAKRWHLVIAGWEQGGHEEELKQLTAILGLRDCVHFVGPQFDEAKAASLVRADAFILPSFSEGLPIVVLEAWSYQLPVLMTAQCNLPEGFAAKAAIEIAPEAANISAALNQLFEMTELERRTMGGRGRKLVEECFAWPTVAASMRSVYSWVLGNGPMPACINRN